LTEDIQPLSGGTEMLTGLLTEMCSYLDETQYICDVTDDVFLVFFICT